MKKLAMLAALLGCSQIATAGGDNAATCKALEERIKAIEAQQRQPQSGQEQDRLAAEKKQARDEQFRLKC